MGKVVKWCDINIDEDNLLGILLFMHWTIEPFYSEKEYYVTTVPKEYAVMRSLISYFPFADKVYDWLAEWVLDVEIVTAEEVNNAIKNFIGNVNRQEALKS